MTVKPSSSASGSSLRLLVITLVAGVFGHSVATAADWKPLPVVLGSALIGMLAAYIASRLRHGVAEIERMYSPKALLGLRTATTGGAIVAIGWLLAVYLSSRLGWATAAVGSAIALVGIVIHFAVQLGGDSEA